MHSYYLSDHLKNVLNELQYVGCDKWTETCRDFCKFNTFCDGQDINNNLYATKLEFSLYARAQRQKLLCTSLEKAVLKTGNTSTRRWHGVRSVYMSWVKRQSWKKPSQKRSSLVTRDCAALLAEGKTLRLSLALVKVAWLLNGVLSRKSAVHQANDNRYWRINGEYDQKTEF